MYNENKLNKLNLVHFFTNSGAKLGVIAACFFKDLHRLDEHV